MTTDFTPAFGKRFNLSIDVINHSGATVHGDTWEITSQNNIGIPYVSRVVNGKAQKRQYAGPLFTLYAERALA